MPKVSQEVFRVRSHSKTIEECHERGKALTLEGRAENIRCPLLVIFGAGDRLINAARRCTESAGDRALMNPYAVTRRRPDRRRS
jgi:hypothetical protein